MNDRSLNRLEARLRFFIVNSVTDPELKEQALDDLHELADGVRELRIRLGRYEPQMHNVRSRIEANARRVDEFAKNILAKYGKSA